MRFCATRLNCICVSSGDPIRPAGRIFRRSISYRQRHHRRYGLWSSRPGASVAQRHHTLDRITRAKHLKRRSRRKDCSHPLGSRSWRLRSRRLSPARNPRPLQPELSASRRPYNPIRQRKPVGKLHSQSQPCQRTCYSNKWNTKSDSPCLGTRFGDSHRTHRPGRAECRHKTIFTATGRNLRQVR